MYRISFGRFHQLIPRLPYFIIFWRAIVRQTVNTQTIQIGTYVSAFSRCVNWKFRRTHRVCNWLWEGCRMAPWTFTPIMTARVKRTSCHCCGEPLLGNSKIHPKVFKFWESLLGSPKAFPCKEIISIYGNQFWEGFGKSKIWSPWDRFWDLPKSARHSSVLRCPNYQCYRTVYLGFIFLL